MLVFCLIFIIFFNTCFLPYKRVDKETVEITAEAEWGVIHALESLTQLIHNIDGYAGINGTNISDFPRFSYRGLLIDTSRHFLPLSIIKVKIKSSKLFTIF